MAWPSFLDRFRRTKHVDGDPIFLIEDTAFAATMPLSTGPRHEEPPSACDRCDKPLIRRILATAIPPTFSPAWDEAPVVVDGALCTGCGTFSYPFLMTAERSVAFGAKGAEHAKAGRLLEAEWWFTRIMWNWPGYAPVYLDLAHVLGIRLEDASLELVRRRAIERRCFDLYERAVEAAEHWDHERTKLLALAHMGLAAHCIRARAIERASRSIAACLALEGLSDADRQQAEELARYVHEERYVFEDASAVVAPHMQVMGETPVPLDTPEARRRIAGAVETLEGHYERVPHHWQSLFMAAKGHAALSQTEQALALWRRARAAHPEVAHISREAGLALLGADVVEEAREVDRDAVARCETDATLWCNLAVTELLCGDVAEAKRCLAKSRALDPKDPIAAALERRIEQLAATGRMPRTLAELEGRARRA